MPVTNDRGQPEMGSYKTEKGNRLAESKVSVVKSLRRGDTHSGEGEKLRKDRPDSVKNVRNGRDT
jgi:hypothetical protein